MANWRAKVWIEAPKDLESRGARLIHRTGVYEVKGSDLELGEHVLTIAVEQREDKTVIKRAVVPWGRVVLIEEEWDENAPDDEDNANLRRF